MGAPGHTGGGAGPPGTATQAGAPPMQQVGAGQDITTPGYSSAQQRESHRLRACLGGPPGLPQSCPQGSSLNTQPCHHHARSRVYSVAPAPRESCAPTAAKRKNLSAHRRRRRKKT